ncbi:PAS domain S-box protein [Undibacterium sp. SXout7W]|uniref:PAS domain S-box protein n=1 Tax=Undibacterium sp. SXout7W TaxID=3413049 RepID=UPI003BF29FA1
MTSSAKFTGLRVQLFIFIFFFISLLAVDAGAATSMVNPPNKITVVVDDNFPPYTLRDESGNLQGLIHDRWQLWQKQTGIKVELIGMDWAKAQQLMLDGGADVIDTISRTPAREPFYEFSLPYADLNVMLYFRNTVSGIIDAKSSRNFVIGVKDGDRCIQHLQDAGATKLKRYPSYEALIKAAAVREVAVFCMNQRPADYFLIRAGIESDFQHTDAMYVSQFYWAVKKGNTGLLQIVADGFASIPSQEQLQLEKKWFGIAIASGYFASLRYGGYILVGLMLGLLLLLIWLRTMRSEVKRQTAALRESEERFRKLFEDTLQAITLVEDGRFIAANKASLAMLRITDLNQFIGRTPADFSPQFQSDGQLSSVKVKEVIATAFAKGSTEFEWEHIRADGEHFIASVLLTVIRQANKDLLHVVWTDITERKRNEMVLLNAKAIIDSSDVAIISKTLQGFITSWNPGAEKLFGYRADETIGQSMQMLIPDDRRNEEPEILARIAEGERVDHFETIRRCKDGHLIHIFANISPIINQEGIVCGASKIARDITQQKKTEQELTEYRQDLEHRVIERTSELVVMANSLRDANDEQQAIFDAATTGIIFVRDRHIVRCNRMIEQLFGYEPGEILGQTTRAWYPDEATFNEIGDTIATALKQQGHYIAERELIRKDGSHFWARIMVQAIDRNDVRKGLVGMIEDVTVERETKEALRRSYQEQMAIFDTATVGIVFTRDRSIVRCNRTMEQLFGYEPNELLGQSMRVVYGDELSFYEVGKQIESTLSTDGYVRFEREVVRKDGTHFCARLTAQVIDAQNSSKGMVGTIEDITAEQAVIVEMKKARTLAEEAARAKADFLANMSHEIRTPMNAVLGMSHLLLKTELTERQHDYLVKIRSAGQHLLGIINDILDFSKAEAGKLRLECAEFDLDSVATNIATLLNGKANEKCLELTIDIAADVPRNLIGDSLRLEQILLNFGSNAVKFTEQGEVHIICRVKEISDTNVLLYFAIRDTGIGLTDEQQGQLFRSFQQADSSTTRKFGGTGLGLVISKQLAGMMGGEVGVDSVPEHGSTFWFTARFSLSKMLPVILMPRPDLRGLRVLVVDDNETARVVLRDMLASMTFVVDEAASGAEAIQLIRHSIAIDVPYAIVFLDWKMPGMDGIEAARQIRTLGLDSSPHLVMVTAYGREELMSQATIAGIDSFLIKPVNPSLLFDTAMQLLGGNRLQQSVVNIPAIKESELLSSLQGARILVVEDNELNQQVATDLLTGAGFVVDLAENGEVALNKLRHSHYDLVFMDMQMPVMDGVTATIAIRQFTQFKDLPIIAMTANAMPADRDRCINAGMNDYISKPIEPDHLWQTLARWISPDFRSKIQPSDPVVAIIRGNSATMVIHEPENFLAQINGLNVARGLRHLSGKTASYITMLRSFCEKQKTVADDIRHVLLNADWQTAERLAHTMKGIAGTLGMDHLQKLSADLELAIKEQHSTIMMDPLWERFSASLQEMILQLQDKLPAESDSTIAIPNDDIARRDAIINELRSLLAQDNFDASALFSDNIRIFEHVFPDHVAKMAAQIADFDFAGAKQTLESACLSIGHHL